MIVDTGTCHPPGPRAAAALLYLHLSLMLEKLSETILSPGIAHTDVTLSTVIELGWFQETDPTSRWWENSSLSLEDSFGKRTAMLPASRHLSLRNCATPSYSTRNTHERQVDVAFTESL